MGLTLPPELAGLLHQAGGQWPQADEDKLHGMAASWRTLSGEFRIAADQTGRVSNNIATQHHGQSVDAYLAQSAEVQQHLRSCATAADSTAVGVDGMAKATLQTKTVLHGGLQKTHAHLQSKKSSLPVKFWGILLRLILRLLQRFWSRIWNLLKKWIFQAVVWLLGQIIKNFLRSIEFFRKLFQRRGGGKQPPKPKPTSPGFPPKAASDKVPKDWGKGGPTQKAAKQGPAKAGWRWRDPSNKGNLIRIDKGNPNSPFPSQRVDHVVIHVNGRIIGPNGRPISGPKPSKSPEAHIPVSDWLKWGSWNHP